METNKKNENITDREFMDSVHILVHSLRLVKGLKPSSAEIKLSQLVIKKFSSVCRECREREEQLKNVPPASKGFVSKLGDILNED